MPPRARRSRLIAVAALIAVGTFVIATHAVAGYQPRLPGAISDSTFSPVSLPYPSAAALAAPRSNPSPIIDAPVLRDAFVSPASPPPDRARPSLPASKPIVVAIAPKTTHAIYGYASYYCRDSFSPCTTDHPDDGGLDRYAAAGPRLRAAIGSAWRGKVVYVDGIRVKLIDWCQCYEGRSNEKLLDLYWDVYDRTGSRVTVRW